MTAAPDATAPTVRAFVGIGANQGDLRSTLQSAFTRLAALPRTALTGRSSLYASAPHEAPGPDFLNAVAELETDLTPLELLHALRGIEAAHGRERPYRNAPRTLDLDLLLYGRLQLETPELTVPHPRLHQRAFVLYPLAELDAALLVPGRGRVADWLVSVAGQSIRRLGAGEAA